MSEVKLAKHNTDSGRMTDSALRQRADERSKLKQRSPDDSLRDSTVKAMAEVETAEQRQVSVVTSDEQPPTSAQPYRFTPKNTPTVQAPSPDSAFSTPYIILNSIPEAQSEQAPTKETQLVHSKGAEPSKGTKNTLFSQPDTVQSTKQPPFKQSTSATASAGRQESRQSDRQSIAQGRSESAISSHVVAPSVQTPFDQHQTSRGSSSRDSLPTTSTSPRAVTPFDNPLGSQSVETLLKVAHPSRTDKLFKTSQPSEPTKEVIKTPDSHQTEPIFTAEVNQTSTIASDLEQTASFLSRSDVPKSRASPVDAQAQETLLKSAKKSKTDRMLNDNPDHWIDPEVALNHAEAQSTVLGASSDVLTGQHHVIADTERDKLKHLVMTSEEQRKAVLSGEKVLKTPDKRNSVLRTGKVDKQTQKTLLKLAGRKSKTDKLLNDNPERLINPDTALNPSASASTDLLRQSSETASRAKSFVAVASKLLRKGGTLLLKAGTRATTSAVLASQAKAKDSDADAQSVIKTYADSAKNTRSIARSLRSLQQRRATKRAAQLGRQTGRTAQQATQKAVTKTAQTGVKGLLQATSQAIQQVFTNLLTAVSGIAVPALVAMLSVVLVVVLFVSLFVSVTGSPYGIFFVKEQRQDLEFDTAVNRLASSYFNRIYEKEMSDDYETVEVNCAITHSEQTWKEILAVYAVEVCKEGLDAITMDAEHYDILKEVFWAKVQLHFRTTTWTERVETIVEPAKTEQIATTDPITGEVTVTTVNIPAQIDVTYITHRTLHITVEEKTLDQLKAYYSFTDGEKKMVDDLLAERDEMWATLTQDCPNLVISSSTDTLPFTGSVDVTSYATVAETVYRALVEHGYSAQAACGILGNIQQECSFNVQCQSGGAYGMCQWMGGRLSSLKLRANYQTATVQTAFLLTELSSQTSIWSTYGGEVGHTYSGVRITSLSAFKACSNVRAAAGAFCICFERSNEFPGNQWYEARLRYAESWYRYAQAHWQS